MNDLQNIRHIIPCLGYHDAWKAMDWLCKAFGFEKHRVYESPEGGVSHAELKLGYIMIMIGTQDHDSPYSQLTKHPSDLGGYETQSPYLVIEDIDRLYDRAVSHGAKIAITLREEHGGKNFSCYDIEGHLWNFGSYDPWNPAEQ